MIKQSGLGKGLGALLPQDSDDARERAMFFCPVEDVRPNRYQPRKLMDDSSIDELAASIREKGIIQPIIVRRADSGYELIAGERRWRAAQKAGLPTIPVIIKDVSPADALELALIENIQRKDLNALEEAEAYERLIREFGLTQEEVAERVGKERSTVANFVRILRLPDYIKEDIWQHKLTMGHARVLAGLENEETQRRLRDAILKKSLSVRQAESLVQRLNKSSRRARSVSKDSHVNSLAEDLMRHLGTKVRISKRGKKGRIEIEFYSEEDLGRIVESITSVDTAI